MYLPSSETERYGITNRFCSLFVCLQKSCSGSEHSYTVVLGSIMIVTQTGLKWLLKTFAVKFFGTSAELERCPFVNTSRARHRDDNYIITLNDLFVVFVVVVVAVVAFLMGILTLFLVFRETFLSLYFASLCHCFLKSSSSHGGNFGCFIRLCCEGACPLTAVR